MTRAPLSGSRSPARTPFLPLKISLLLILSALLLAGCISRRAPSAVVQRYALEYPSPQVTNLSPVEFAIKVERFSAAKTYSGRSMVFRPEPYKLDSYASNYWMVNPGDMVSDYLLRDLRNSGLFKAVFSFRDLEDGRYALEGSVVDFLEIDENGERRAVLTLSVTLLDLSQSGVPARLLFQKRYSAEEPLRQGTPAGLAEAMSTAMKTLSARIITDIHEVVTEAPYKRK